MTSQPTNPPQTLADMRATIARFNRRVDDAQAAAAPSMQWVRDALHKKGGPRCPVRLRRLSLDIILRYGDRLADLFCRYPDDAYFAAPYDLSLGYQPQGPEGIIDAAEALTQDVEWTDEWGTIWRHASGGVGASTVKNPLQDWSGLDGLLQRMPDPCKKGRFDAIAEPLKRLGPRQYFVGITHMLAYERLHSLRGMENTFEDFYTHPKEVDRLLDALIEYFVGIIHGWGSLGNVDGIFMTEDWGTQQSLMISPDMWRRFFAAGYRRICDEAHRAGLDVIFHSCGNVTAIIGDLIDIGIDVLDPLQPEAMDLKQVARDYGGKVAFCGGLSNQDIVRQTPAQVKNYVRRIIDLLGKASGNAYLFSPSNVLTPEIPFENIQALFEASHGQ